MLGRLAQQEIPTTQQQEQHRHISPRSGRLAHHHREEMRHDREEVQSLRSWAQKIRMEVRGHPNWGLDILSVDQ